MLSPSDTFSSAPYRIFAEFVTTDESFGPFLLLCHDDARHSRQEPGCLDFTVLTPAEERNTIVLFETYRDKDAFDAHKKTPHYARFKTGLENMKIETRCVRPLLTAQSAPEGDTVID